MSTETKREALFMELRDNEGRMVLVNIDEIAHVKPQPQKPGSAQVWMRPGNRQYGDVLFVTENVESIRTTIITIRENARLREAAV